VKDMGGRVKTIGVDAARVLNSSGIRNTRNINSDSNFDEQLDPYGPREMFHPIKIISQVKQVVSKLVIMLGN
jgi:hypothetical protein